MKDTSRNIKNSKRTIIKEEAWPGFDTRVGPLDH